MERIEISIYKIKKDINDTKLKIQKMQNKINNEHSEYVIEDLMIELQSEKKKLLTLNTKLNEEINNDKKEKFTYRKSLEKVKESLNDFYKVSRTNSKLKKHIQEINNVMITIETYLNNPCK